MINLKSKIISLGGLLISLSAAAEPPNKTSHAIVDWNTTCGIWISSESASFKEFLKPYNAEMMTMILPMDFDQIVDPVDGPVHHRYLTELRIDQISPKLRFRFTQRHIVGKMNEFDVLLVANGVQFRSGVRAGALFNAAYPIGNLKHTSTIFRCGEDGALKRESSVNTALHFDDNFRKTLKDALIPSDPELARKVRRIEFFLHTLDDSEVAVYKVFENIHSDKKDYRLVGEIQVNYQVGEEDSRPVEKIDAIKWNPVSDLEAVTEEKKE